MRPLPPYTRTPESSPVAVVGLTMMLPCGEVVLKAILSSAYLLTSLQQLSNKHVYYLNLSQINTSVDQLCPDTCYSGRHFVTFQPFSYLIVLRMLAKNLLP